MKLIFLLVSFIYSTSFAGEILYTNSSKKILSNEAKIFIMNVLEDRCTNQLNRLESLIIVTNATKSRLDHDIEYTVSLFVRNKENAENINLEFDIDMAHATSFDLISFKSSENNICK